MCFKLSLHNFIDGQSKVLPVFLCQQQQQDDDECFDGMKAVALHFKWLRSLPQDFPFRDGNRLFSRLHD